MKQRLIIKILLIIVIVLFIIYMFGSRVVDTLHQIDDNPDSTTPTQNKSDSYTTSDVTLTPVGYSIDEVDSLWLIVNKTRPIPLEYVPVDLRAVGVEKRADKSDEELQMREAAATALEKLFMAAKDENLALLMGSAYRSAELQEYYYSNYVSAYGQEQADTFSAKPGTSEHQIGLAVDVSTVDRECYLEICFADTTAGKWLQNHAHEYGFIIRYPKGKESITGYQFEPWHLRYVGNDLAAEIVSSGDTLEEHFNLSQ